MGETVNTPDMEAAREEFREAQRTRGISNADAAKQIGVGSSTLLAWLSGSYAGNNARVAEQVRTWVRHQEEQTQHRAALPVLPDYIATPTAEAILAVARHAQVLPDIVLVTGGAGIGKTTALREYQRTHPQVWLHTAEPAAASVHAMLEGICDAMGVSENAANRRSRSIVKKAQGSGGLLIVDEGQHLSSAALDQLRTIHDLGRIGVVVAGNSEVFARIDGDSRRGLFAQFKSRVGMRINRNRPLNSDVNALLDAAGVTGNAERRLLHAVAAKPGALRGIAKTLRRAHMLAAASGGAITEAAIAQSVASMDDGSAAGEAV